VRGDLRVSKKSAGMSQSNAICWVGHEVDAKTDIR
jgi:hypothetical protein